METLFVYVVAPPLGLMIGMLVGWAVFVLGHL
jgi:hypothetical protein